MFSLSIPNTYFGRGNTYLALKQYDKAIADYNKALALEPDQQSVFKYTLYRGFAYLHSGKTSQSIEDFEKAITIDSQYSYTYYLMGHALMRLDRNQEAIAAFRKFILFETDATSINTAKEYIAKLGVKP